MDEMEKVVVFSLLHIQFGSVNIFFSDWCVVVASIFGELRQHRAIARKLFVACPLGNLVNFGRYTKLFQQLSQFIFGRFLVSRRIHTEIAAPKTAIRACESHIQLAPYL